MECSVELLKGKRLAAVEQLKERQLMGTKAYA